MLISYWIHNVLDVQSELEEHLYKQHFLANTWDLKGILQRNEDTYYLYSIPLGLWYGFPLLFCVGCSRCRPLFILLRSFGISGLVIWSAVTRTNGVVVVLGFSSVENKTSRKIVVLWIFVILTTVYHMTKCKIVDSPNLNILIHLFKYACSLFVPTISNTSVFSHRYSYIMVSHRYGYIVCK